MIKIFQILFLLIGGLNLTLQPNQKCNEVKISSKDNCWIEFDHTTKVNLDSIEFVRLSCKQIEKSENFVHSIEPSFPTKFTYENEQNCPNTEENSDFQIRRK